MIEIARIFTFGTSNRRDIIRRLMATSEYFRGLTFSDACHAYRYAENNNLVKYGDGWIAVYHDCD